MVSLSIFEILNKGKNKKEQSFHILQTVKTILKKKKKKKTKVNTVSRIPNLHLIWFNSPEKPLKQGKQLLQEKTFLHKAKFFNFRN